MAYDHDATGVRVWKRSAREMVWSLVKGPAKKVLLFPGKNCEDIKMGMELGKINADTEFILVERDRKIVPFIRKECEHLGLRNIEIVNKSFSGRVFQAGNKFDLIFLDFCGEMTETIFESIKSILEYGDCVAMTFATNFRNNNFRRQYPEYRRSFRFPSNAMVLANGNVENAKWSCDTALHAMGVDCKVLVSALYYHDLQGMPMVFFALDNSIKEEKEESKLRYHCLSNNGVNSPSWAIRKIIELHQEYDKATSSGIKAAIKRQMNKMLRKGGEGDGARQMVTLQRKYDKATSSGIKATIKRQMHDLLA